MNTKTSRCSFIYTDSNLCDAVFNSPQVKGSFSSSSTTECEVADNPSQDSLSATASTPDSGMTLESVPVPEESYGNQSINGDRDHLNRTKSQEPSENMKKTDTEHGDIKQALLCHQIEAKKSIGHEEENCTNRTCDANIGFGIMLESKSLKKTVDMDNKCLTSSMEDINYGQMTNNGTDQDKETRITNEKASAVRRGTEIQFRGLDLEENVSTLIGNRIVFTLECNRCRQRIDQQLHGSGYVLVTLPACEQTERSI